MLDRSFCQPAGHRQGKGKTGSGNGESSPGRMRSLVWTPSCKGDLALLQGIEESKERLANGDSRYFGRSLPADQQFRLFEAFRHTVVYLDIETTGLSSWDEVTTIATWDGTRIRTYIQGQNLDAFSSDIRAYGLIVTFNGKTFDLPFSSGPSGLPPGPGPY